MSNDGTGLRVDVDALAQEIRRVDGSHSLGAGALAEALVPYIAALSAVAPLPVLEDVSVAQATAPERIWLAVSDDTFDAEHPFPGSGDWEHVCWSADAPLEVCVPYIRADLAAIPAAPAQQAVTEYTLVVIDDADQTFPIPCANRTELLTAVHERVFNDGRDFEDYEHDEEVCGITDELIADGVFHFEGDRPIYLHRAALTREAAPQASAFERAMKASWEMVNPFDQSVPGSYNKGQHNGMVAALRTVQENYETELRRLATTDSAIQSQQGATGGAVDGESALWLLRQILHDMPKDRDWLDPQLESVARQLLKRNPYAELHPQAAGSAPVGVEKMPRGWSASAWAAWLHDAGRMADPYVQRPLYHELAEWIVDIAATPAVSVGDAKDAARWRHVREMFAEEMLETLFGVDPSVECNATDGLDAACDADIESDAALEKERAE